MRMTGGETLVRQLELEGVTQSGAAAQETSAIRTPAPVRGGRTAAPSNTAQPAGARGTLVSLRLDLATYFSRAGTEKPVAP